MRLWAIEDVAMVTHTLRALRDRHPNLKVSILTQEQFQPLFRDFDVEFITIDLKGRHKGIIGIYRLASDIAKQGVDAVADLHNILQTKLLRLFLRLRSIRCNHLYKGVFRRWLRMSGGCSSLTQPIKHTVNKYCDVIRRLGIAFSAPLAAPKIERSNPMPYEKGDEVWIGVAPFSQYKSKCYPRHLIKQVIAILSKRYDRVFIHGAESELSIKHAQEMVQELSNIELITSQLTLAEQIDLISNEDCIISMDSFAMHAASMVATPVASIWGGTHPYMGFSPYLCSSNGYIQIDDLSCRPCSRQGEKPCKFGDYNCLTMIKPEDIVARVELLITKAEI